MTTDLTLPGSIPGLLRRGSPTVLPDGARHVVEGMAGVSAYVPGLGGGAVSIDALSLDLTDPTGRVHAAWWAGSEPGALAWKERLTTREHIVLIQLCEDARQGAVFSNVNMGVFRDLLLKLANVTP